jgi:hypothetical protein
LVEKSFSKARDICNSGSNSDFEAIAKALINVFDLMNCTRPFLRTVLEEAVKLTPSAGVLLRETTVQTRMLSYYIQLEGTSYVRSLLLNFINEIVGHEEASFEVNASKAGGEEKALQNGKMLQSFTERLLDRIISSVPESPESIRILAHYLREYAVQKFPESTYSSVGGLLFLRYLCPALLVPEEWGLVSGPLSAKVSRNLVLVAKILQNIGNGIEFGTKEEYMMRMNAIVKTYLPEVQKFFDEFSSPPKEAFDIPHKSVDKGEVDACMSDIDYLMRVLSKIQGGGTVNPKDIGTLKDKLKGSNTIAAEVKTPEKPSFLSMQKSMEEALRIKTTEESKNIPDGPKSAGLPAPTEMQISEVSVVPQVYPTRHRRARSSVDVLPSQLTTKSAEAKQLAEERKINAMLPQWEGKVITPLEKNTATTPSSQSSSRSKKLPASPIGVSTPGSKPPLSFGFTQSSNSNLSASPDKTKKK